VIAIAAKLEQQLSDVRLRSQEYKENGLRRHCGNNCHPAAVLKNGRDELSASNGCAQVVRRTDNWWNQGGDAFRVDARHRLTIDEESVAAEHYGCFDSFALSNRSNEIPDAGHLGSSRKVVAKLEIENVEVKL
jgi:hypothetical protein